MYVDGVSSKGRPKRYKSRNLHTNLAEAQNDNAFRCVCRQPNSMVLLVPIHYTETYNPKDECANKCRHKGCGNHRAAMLLVLPSLTCCELNIALFAMYMWLWLEYTSDSRHDGFWGVLWRGRRARRGVCVVMGMRVELDIVVLCYCRILCAARLARCSTWNKTKHIHQTQTWTTCPYSQDGRRRRHRKREPLLVVS